VPELDAWTIPGICAFSLILWHGNTTKKESGFLRGFTASIALHNLVYGPFGIAKSQKKEN